MLSVSYCNEEDDDPPRCPDTFAVVAVAVAVALGHPSAPDDGVDDGHAEPGATISGVQFASTRASRASATVAASPLYGFQSTISMM